LAAAGAWFAACASAPTQPVGVAQVSLESYQGLPAAEESAPSLPRRFDILVDLTESMGRPGVDGRPRASDAYSRASELMRSLPQGTEITLRAQGHQAGNSCALPQRLAGPAIPTLRSAFVRQLEGLGPRTEGSLPAALSRIRLELERQRAVRRTRVVLFTDLDSHCGGDLCGEARALVEAGAQLEVVALAASPLPPCLAELQSSQAKAQRRSPRLLPPPPLFRIHAAEPGAEGFDPAPIARGRAGEQPVEVPAGLITMVVELDPPEMIGPFRVEPGKGARVRLLDYPQARPPTRIWRVEREGEAVSSAFPPPEMPSVSAR
jgi:hypothetical protein